MENVDSGCGAKGSGVGAKNGVVGAKDGGVGAKDDGVGAKDGSVGAKDGACIESAGNFGAGNEACGDDVIALWGEPDSLSLLN
eukprot:6209944-Pleurochrysis_carterae.AAC.2